MIAERFRGCVSGVLKNHGARNVEMGVFLSCFLGCAFLFVKRECPSLYLSGHPRLFSLMLWAVEVVDRLDRVESGEGHFDEDGVPVAHRSVPESGQFKRLEFFSVFAFV